MLIQGETGHLKVTAADVTALHVSNLSFAQCDMGWAAIVEHNSSRSLSGDADYKAAVRHFAVSDEFNPVCSWCHRHAGSEPTVPAISNPGIHGLLKLTTKLRGRFAS